MFALVNGSYRKTLAFVRVAGTHMAVKNVYARVGVVWRPVWAYTWDAGGWGNCSRTCGGGTQTRSVTCRRNDGMTVDDRFCEAAKPPTSQACNTHPCYTYKWKMDGWGACSKVCGRGTQYRDVWCERNDGVTVSGSLCSGSSPESSRTCNNGTCSWKQGGWGPWSTSCGSATRTQTVKCLAPSGSVTAETNCDKNSKPATSQSSTVCTGCAYNENAYLNNKLQHISRLGSSHPKPPGGGSWNASNLRSFTIAYWGSVQRAYNVCGAMERVCGFSNTTCCANAGRTNNGPVCTIQN